MDKEILYQMCDLFMAGTSAAEIAAVIKATSIEVMEHLQSDEGRAYMDKIRQLRRMELDALSDGPAVDAVRDGLSEGTKKDRLTAADMAFKATGKYSDQSGTVATLAEILKKVMSDGDEEEKKAE